MNQRDAMRAPCSVMTEVTARPLSLDAGHPVVEEPDAVGDRDLADGSVELDAVDVQSAQLEVEGWLAEPFAGDVVRRRSVGEPQSNVAFPGGDSLRD